MNRLKFSDMIDRTSHTLDDEGSNLAAIESIYNMIRHKIDGINSITWKSSSKYDLTFTITSNKQLNLNSIPEISHWLQSMAMVIEPVDDNNINIHIRYNNSR